MAESSKLKITIRFFAAAAAAAGVDTETLKIKPEQLSLAQTVQLASVQPLDQILEVSSYLVDGCMYPADTKLTELLTEIGHCGSDNEEAITIDVLPPFAGG